LRDKKTDGAPGGITLAEADPKSFRLLESVAIAGGNLDQKIDVHTGDELQDLAEQFNNMAAKLSESYAGLERKVEERTAELTRSLAEMRALGEVVKAVNSSLDLQRVLVTIVTHAVELSHARQGTIYEIDEASGVFEPRANFGMSETIVEILRNSKFRVGDTMVGQCVAERVPVQMHDVTKGTGYRLRALMEHEGIRSILAVPLLREDQPIGALVIRRSEAGEFPPSLVDLLQTLAAQSVLAIQNARLFNETKEALEQQTATGEILRVISSSPTDVQPVFDIIGERAERLCAADVSVVSRFDGELIQLVALHGVAPEGAETVRRAFPMRPDVETVTARAFRNCTVIHIADVLADPLYQQKGAARAGGYRGCLGVPMVREGQVIGAIFVARTEPGGRRLYAVVNQPMLEPEGIADAFSEFFEPKPLQSRVRVRSLCDEEHHDQEPVCRLGLSI
jgi:GAF domain-containing protein